MAFVCAITGEVPEIPVISLISNNIFEKRILEKYIQTNGKDPITNEPMTLDDFIQVKSANISPPKYSSQESIPAILKLLQDEWDTFVLENYERSKTLNSIREELSLSLFNLDSACRVIARLMKENEELRQALSQMGSNVVIQQESISQDVEMDEKHENKIPADFREKVVEKLGQLSSDRKRKNKNIPIDLADQSTIKNYQILHQKILHSQKEPGILCMDLRVSDSLILTGGKDKSAILYNRSSDEIITTFKGHTKSVTHAIFHNSEPMVITGSSDTHVRLWKEDKSKSIHIFKDHSTSIGGLSMHPLGSHLLSSSSNLWVLTDISIGKTVVDFSISQNACSEIHPDGAIFALGSESGIITFFDFREGQNVIDFSDHSNRINHLAFSENGYYFASSSKDNSIRLWDLRKTKSILKLDTESDSVISFDETGQYFAYGNKSINLYGCKKLENFASFEEFSSPLTSIKFGNLAKYFVSSSIDGNLRIFTKLN